MSGDQECSTLHLTSEPQTLRKSRCTGLIRTNTTEFEHAQGLFSNGGLKLAQSQEHATDTASEPPGVIVLVQCLDFSCSKCYTASVPAYLAPAGFKHTNCVCFIPLS